MDYCIERGERLRKIRLDMRMTQMEFASHLKVSQQIISLCEKGRIPNDQMLRKLVEMGYSIDWLLTGEGDMKRPDRRHPDIVYPDPRVVQDFSILRDAPPSEEKSRRLLILMKELVCEFLKDPEDPQAKKKENEK